jgi:uncharacterized phage protein (TIGR02218 family)
VKTLPAGLAASLASGVTTLCYCWRLERRDGLVLGFTDHDADLSFAGDLYEAASGFTASAFAATAGLAVDTIDAMGALSNDSLTEEDLANGLWDDATVKIFLVDWSAPANRLLLCKSSVGEVTRGVLAFRAELRAMAHRLNQEVGRVYSRPCDAVLGDARCTVNLNLAAFKGDGTVTASSDNLLLTASGLGAFAAGWFTGGRLEWTGGDNAGARTEVSLHRKTDGTVTLALVEKAVQPVAFGDAFTVRAGCDKALETCRVKFDNVENHRGFPTIPGDDFALSYAAPGDGKHDGGSFFN